MAYRHHSSHSVGVRIILSPKVRSKCPDPARRALLHGPNVRRLHVMFTCVPFAT